MPVADDAPSLDCRGVDLAYTDQPIVHGLDLVVPPGALVALLGPSGSGKSTILRGVAGFLAPTAGEIRLAGRVVADERTSEPPERRSIGMVFQDFALWPHLTALDTVAYPLRRNGHRKHAAQERARELLQRLEIEHLAARRPAELSGGEQQRVGLARALARRPRLFLFDEPTAHLDAHLRSVFTDELSQQREAGGAGGLYATHDAAEALSLADRLVLLRDGRVVQTGEPLEVYTQPVDVWAARLTGPASLVGDVVVRPEWASLDGPLGGTVRTVRYRGSHTDYALDTPHGAVTVRDLRAPTHVVGEHVSWRIDRGWVLGPSQRRWSPQDHAHLIGS